MNRSLNIGYLVVGLVFLGLSGAWLLDETGVIDPDGFKWFLPAVLLAAGLIGLFASLGKGVAARRSRPEPTYADDVPVIPDLTSDLDRKLADHEATTKIDTHETDHEGSSS
jgi:hypothetical protein